MNETELAPVEGSPAAATPPLGRRRSDLVKFVVFIVLAVICVPLAVVYREELSLDKIEAHAQRFDAFRQDHPVLVYGVAFAVYVLVTGMSLPGATLMTLMYGSLFGFWRALILVSFASTTGASVAFLTSRYLLRGAVQARFGKQLATINRAWELEGAYYLFTLRLVPIVPFFIVNLVMGLTPVRARTFWWVSQVGMLPGTCVYVYAGSRIQIDKLADHGLAGILDWQLFLAFTLLGLFPITVKKLLGWLRPRQEGV